MDENSRASADSREGEDSRAGANLFAGMDDPLVVWSLAAFHTALLVAVLVLVLHLSGSAGDLLAGFQTAVGFTLYLGLWASTWWTNRRWLGAIADSETTVWDALGTAAKWGGVDGVCFLWLILVVFVASRVGLEIEAAPFVALAAVVGSVLALGIGGFVGVVFGLLDLALFRLAARFGPAPPTSDEQ